MTRKDFEAIARALHKSMPDKRNTAAYEQWEKTFHAIVSEVAPMNANYDPERFAKACGRTK